MSSKRGISEYSMSNDVDDNRWFFGVFLRAFGVIIGITLLDAATYVAGWCGDRGIFPFFLVKQKQRELFPSLLQRLHLWPSAWLPFTSSTSLRTLAIVGSFCGFLYAAVGHAALLIASGLVMLLLHEPCCLHWPWHALTLELWWVLAIGSVAGNATLEPLAVWPLATTESTAVMSLAAAQPPPFPLLIALRVLLFRVLFGFGKLKFSGSTMADRMYVRPFLVMLPVLSPLGLVAFRIVPRILFLLGYAAFFVGEIITPFFYFAPQPYRGWAAANTMLLMFGIQCSGFFGTFNVLGAALAFSLFASAPPSSPTLSVADSSLADNLSACLHCMLVLNGLCLLPFNSWVATSWFHFPALKRALPKLTSYFEFLAVWRLNQPYGVFPPNTVSPMRHIHVFEVSSDGKSWTPLRYRYQPTQASEKATFAPLLHPILDFTVRYHTGGFFSSVMEARYPYANFVSRRVTEVARNLLSDGDAKLLFASASTDLLNQKVPRYVRVVQQAMVALNYDEWMHKGMKEEWRLLDSLVEVPPVSLADLDGPLLPQPFVETLDDTDPCMTNWRRRSGPYQTVLADKDAVFRPLLGAFQQQVAALVDSYNLATNKETQSTDFNAAVRLFMRDLGVYGGTAGLRFRRSLQRAAYRCLQELEDKLYFCSTNSSPAPPDHYDMYLVCLAQIAKFITAAGSTSSAFVLQDSPAQWSEQERRLGQFVFTYLFARTLTVDTMLYRIMNDARCWAELDNVAEGEKVLPGGVRVMRQLSRSLVNDGLAQEVRHRFSFNRASQEYEYSGQVQGKDLCWPWTPPKIHC